MPAITLLVLSLLLPSANTCNTEDDETLRQTIHYYTTKCKCREYLDVYATCYDPFSCLQFPRQFQTPLKCFKLQTTGIQELSAGDFSNLTHLAGLYIEANQYLSRIQSGAFKDMKHLVTLSISYNINLTKLDEDVFKGLSNLETLSLTRNGFTDFKDFSASLKTTYMPKLKTVNLKELNCPRVDKDDFSNLNGSQVTSISFDDSNITFIHDDALSPFRNLRNLSVSQTLLTDENLVDVLRKMISNGTPLSSLNLTGWGFKANVRKELFNVIANTTIKGLVLNRNQFHVIDESTFPEISNIEHLFLEQSLVTDVKENAFSNFPKLAQLYLKQNKLIYIPKGVLLPTVQLLDVSENSRAISSYFTVENNNFIRMSSLRTLDLSSNNLRIIFNQTFNGLTNLKRLNLHNCNIVSIANYSFDKLVNLEHLSLGQNRFPERTFSKNIFKGLTNLKYLSLESCRINYFPSSDVFGYLSSLETLILKKNFIEEITPIFVISLKMLKVLNVDDNKIKMWNKRLFQSSKVENFTASHNTFTYLTEAMLSDISEMKMIDLSNNPFYCDCENLIESFGSLTQSKLQHVLNILNRTKPGCLLPEKLDGKTITGYYKKNYPICEQEKIAKLTSYLIPSLAGVALILSIVILSYIYRWHIRYWVFLTKLAISKRTQFKKRENVQSYTNYLYDAFVSYSTEDRNFVIRLVSMLENYEPFLKLCVYERDFEIGTIISESVLESLSRSRKTLLVISNSYIKSQWCTWEAQVAENHRLFFENENGECVNDSLIMVKLGNISSNNISPMLRYLMKTRIYLQWDPADGKQKQFWEKLRNALAPALNSKDEKT